MTIEVANRRLKVACPQGQESALLQAAEELNQRITKDNSKGQSLKTPEQAMLMTALNLAHDYLAQQRKFAQEKQALQSQVDLLQQTIEQAVKQPKKHA
ncbi:cell division protein ZapA [Thalassotalea insulae]|uniref:Cell division protein ZapA n=1 Tax=Thalassotalea insulae TaxID=2056778 RepID=A0ABQ6GLZ0_9GAMM|nr:cell division protein ZapA [Thalassotalea insulae]